MSPFCFDSGRPPFVCFVRDKRAKKPRNSKSHRLFLLFLGGFAVPCPGFCSSFPHRSIETLSRCENWPSHSDPPGSLNGSSRARNSCLFGFPTFPEVCEIWSSGELSVREPAQPVYIVKRCHSCIATGWGYVQNDAQHDRLYHVSQLGRRCEASQTDNRGPRERKQH